MVGRHVGNSDAGPTRGHCRRCQFATDGRYGPRSRDASRPDALWRAASASGARRGEPRRRAEPKGAAGRSRLRVRVLVQGRREHRPDVVQDRLERAPGLYHLVCDVRNGAEQGDAENGLRAPDCPEGTGAGRGLGTGQGLARGSSRRRHRPRKRARGRQPGRGPPQRLQCKAQRSATPAQAHCRRTCGAACSPQHRVSAGKQR